MAIIAPLDFALFVRGIEMNDRKVVIDGAIEFDYDKLYDFEMPVVPRNTPVHPPKPKSQRLDCYCLDFFRKKEAIKTEEIKPWIKKND
jgi:hypothetical protein